MSTPTDSQLHLSIEKEVVAASDTRGNSNSTASTPFPVGSFLAGMSPRPSVEDTLASANTLVVAPRSFSSSAHQTNSSPRLPAVAPRSIMPGAIERGFFFDPVRGSHSHLSSRPVGNTFLVRDNMHSSFDSEHRDGESGNRHRPDITATKGNAGEYPVYFEG